MGSALSHDVDYNKDGPNMWPSKLPQPGIDYKNKEGGGKPISSREVDIARQILTNAQARCAFLKFLRSSENIANTLGVFNNIEKFGAILSVFIGNEKLSTRTSGTFSQYSSPVRSHRASTICSFSTSSLESFGSEDTTDSEMDISSSHLIRLNNFHKIDSLSEAFISNNNISPCSTPDKLSPLCRLPPILTSNRSLDTLSEMFMCGKYNLLNAFEGTQNEIVVIMGLSLAQYFEQSNEYKEWEATRRLIARKQHSLHVVDHCSSKDMLRHLALKRSSLTAHAPLRENSADVSERILAKMDISRIDTILSKGSWMTCLTAAMMSLPLAVTLSLISTMTTTTNSFVFINDQMAMNSGYLPQELLHKDIRLLTTGKVKEHTKDVQKKNNETNKCICNGFKGTEPFDCIINQYKKDGTTIKTRVFFKPLLSAFGYNKFFYAIHYNISEDGLNKTKIRMIEDLLALLPAVIPTGFSLEGFVHY